MHGSERNVAEFPRSPKLLKGAFALYKEDSSTSPGSLVIFQYNPEQVRRSLANRTPQQQPGTGGGQGAREDVRRVAGPPVETISLSIVLNAADQLEAPNENELTAAKGLYPALAALEMSMYSPAMMSEQLSQLAAAGEVTVEPASLPMTVLVWGESRVVPVSITSFSIVEEAFDPRLNPIRAKLDLGLKVLTSLEFPNSSLGRDSYIAYQKNKEQLAARYSNTSDDTQIRKFLPRPN
jgi:hypothetical protein